MNKDGYKIFINIHLHNTNDSLQPPTILKYIKALTTWQFWDFVLLAETDLFHLSQLSARVLIIS